MKLTIFQSDKGDCLLLEGKNGELVLCDGGMGPSMRGHVRARLSKLRDDGRALELAYVSHIDNDHISGILQLLEDEVEWRVFDHHQSNGNPVSKPKAPRPPVIKGILHNAFRDQIAGNRGSVDGLATAMEIENLLTSMVPSLLATAVPDFMALADEMQAIATGVPEAIKVSKLIAADALDIPLNQPPGTTSPAQLLFAGRPGEKFDVGDMKFTLIGPTAKELSDLRDGWNNWLRDNKERLKEIRAELRRRVDEFSTGALTLSPFDLRDWNGIPDFKGVSIPNVASLMFMVEEDGKRLLLTGDGQQDFILDGLERTGFLDGGSLHLDVLKVQHHGSENNMDVNFAKRVSADHYVFCGDGEHENPDLRVIEILFNSRFGRASVRAPAPANRKVHFWFSTKSDLLKDGSAKKKYFEEVEAEAERLVGRSGGQLKVHFNGAASTVLRV
jgi:hypothetical protein